MTQAALIDSVIAAARSFLGFNEADGSHRSIIDLYNSIRPLPRGYAMKYTDPWCAAFVSAVAQKCGLTSVILPECACEQMIALYKKRGGWIEDDSTVPRPGDLIMFDWQDGGQGDALGSADHVGIICQVSGSRLLVIEGNAGDAVGYRELYANAQYIRGYCRPDYSAAAGGYAAPAAAMETGVPLSLRQLSRDSMGSDVRAMQLLLMGHGFSCGRAGADGELGPDTEGALKAFQRSRALSPDGICGVLTWGALLGL